MEVAKRTEQSLAWTKSFTLIKPRMIKTLMEMLSRSLSSPGLVVLI